MGGKFGNIIWTMNPKEPSIYRKMNENDFVKALNHALNYDMVLILGQTYWVMMETYFLGLEEIW